MTKSAPAAALAARAVVVARSETSERLCASVRIWRVSPHIPIGL